MCRVGLLILGWALSGPGWAAETERLWVDAEVNTHLVRMGEPFRLVVTAGAKNGWVRLPGAALLLPGCRVLRYREQDVSKRHEGYIARQGVYELAAFVLREVKVPEISITAYWAEGGTSTARSWPQSIRLISMNPEAGLSLIDPRPPQDVPKRWPVVAAGLAGLGLLAGGGLFYRHRRKIRTAPDVPAHITALAQLEGLGRYRLAAEERIEDYFVALSRIMRNYLAQRYQFPAMEYSRIAILRTLERLGIEAKRREMIDQVLQEADLVKFARVTVSIARLAQAQAQAREFVELTRRPNVRRD